MNEHTTEQVSITKLDVTLCTVRVDGKRMAKLIYNQVPCVVVDINNFDKYLSETDGSVKLLGWIPIHVGSEHGYFEMLAVVNEQLQRIILRHPVSTLHINYWAERERYILAKKNVEASFDQLYIGA